MSRKRVLAIAAVAVVALAAVTMISLLPGGPDPAQFEHLKQPQVRTMADQRVLVVTAKGDPATVGGGAFSLLFKTYFKLEGVPKNTRELAPRARWPLSLHTPKDQWIGRYAMPVPESIDALPEQAAGTSGLYDAELKTWEYGEVAEILHVGPYDREEPTIRRLMDFIKNSGYVITGEHEEEYIQGPGIIFRGNPEKYLTIIRYRVRKAQ